MMWSNDTQVTNEMLYMRDVRSDTISRNLGVTYILYICYEVVKDGSAYELTVSYSDENNELRTISKKMPKLLAPMFLEDAVYDMIDKHQASLKEVNGD